MTEPLNDERLTEYAALPTFYDRGCGAPTPFDFDNAIRALLAEVARLKAELAEAKREADHNTDLLLLFRKIIVRGTAETRDEVKALEPGRSAETCQVIDFWNRMEAANACRRNVKELRTENATLRDRLQWVLTADADELDQWRNGDYAAGLANGMGLTLADSSQPSKEDCQ